MTLAAILFNRAGKPVPARADGVLEIRDLHKYTLKSSVLVDELRPHVVHIPGLDGKVASVCFDNFVGRAHVGPLIFDVRHSKLSDAQFDDMLELVLERTHDLLFGFESPTGFGVGGRAAVTTDAIPFHALAYLRHAMTRLRGGEAFLGQFLQVARHPHRKVEVEPTWQQVSLVSSVSPAGLAAIASHPEHLQPIHATHPLAATSLGRAIHRATGQWRFPSQVLSSRRDETFDTNENRLLKSLLREARDLVALFEGRPLRNPALIEDLQQMRGELRWMASHDFLSEVGELTVFPSASTVLQRRSGYKELFQHWLALRAGTALADDKLWERLLDAKDCATLYELWCFFAVKAILDEQLGASTHVKVEVDDTTAVVPWKAEVAWDARRVVLSFNLPYPAQGADRPKQPDPTSAYSVPMRPDLTVHVARQSCRREALVLDAKFKFDGARLTEVESEDATRTEAEPAEAPERKTVAADLHKMHTYRDALRDVSGAFVLFPGNAERTYRAQAESRPWEGIGAMPLAPGTVPTRLRELLAEFCRS